MKSNPLFIDSTKFKGEIVVAEIEVEGIDLHLTERVFAKVTLSDNRTYTQELKLRSNKFVGNIRLYYRQPAWIKYIIMCGSDQVEVSNETKFLVNYNNQFKWYRPVKTLAELTTTC